MPNPSIRHSLRRLRALVVGAALALLAGILPATGPLPSPTRQAAAEGGGGALQTIPFDDAHQYNEHLVLGDLASRTQRKEVTIAGIGPYTVSGTDSRTGQPYSFVTDRNYNPASRVAWGREGDERALNAAFTTSITPGFNYGGRAGAMRLSSATTCLSGNTFDDLTTYCSVFGPHIYSEPFTASLGEAVSFDWAASGAADDYEIYAFLVKVSDAGDDPRLVEPEDHTLLAYGRGASQGWTTTSATIPEAGTYRFWFVNGSYDATGGYWLGADMYIDPDVKVGLANPVDFPAIGDKLLDDGSFELEATAPGGPVTYSTTTPSRCTVAGSTVTLVSLGICTIVADQAGDGVDYVPAESTARSFTILAAPTAPTNSGPPSFTGTFADGETVTVNEGTWADGGSPITDTLVEWLVDTGEGYEPIEGATGATCNLVEEEGSTLRVRVTKTNAVGSTTVASTQTLGGFSCQVDPPPGGGGGGGGAAPTTPGEEIVLEVELQPPSPGTEQPPLTLSTSTASGTLTVTLTGAIGQGSAPRVIIRPLGVQMGTGTDRGVTAVTERYSIVATDLGFQSAEICLPVDSTAFAQQGRPVDRLRLLHVSNGVERDVTTLVDLSTNPGRICGVTSGFSEFQAVVYMADRLSGPDRYATAAAVALDSFPGGAGIVYLASGERHPDALTAGLAAARSTAPVLLTTGTSLPPATRAALQALAPSSVVIVGGSSAVGAGVQAEVAALGATVTRVSGPDRYATAAAMSAQLHPDTAEVVYLATGSDFADALAAAAVAGQQGAALLLAERDHLPESTAAALGRLSPQRIVIVGGTAAISSAVQTQLASYAGEVTRVHGADRYATAAALAAGWSWDSAVVATGRSFADALVAAPLAARHGAPVLLVAGDSVPEPTRQAITQRSARSLYVIGGRVAVGAQAELTLTRLLPQHVPSNI